MKNILTLIFTLLLNIPSFASAVGTLICTASFQLKNGEVFIGSFAITDYDAYYYEDTNNIYSNHNREHDDYPYYEYTNKKKPKFCSDAGIDSIFKQRLRQGDSTIETYVRFYLPKYFQPLKTNTIWDDNTIYAFVDSLNYRILKIKDIVKIKFVKVYPTEYFSLGGPLITILPQFAIDLVTKQKYLAKFKTSTASDQGIEQGIELYSYNPKINKPELERLFNLYKKQLESRDGSIRANAFRKFFCLCLNKNIIAMQITSSGC